MEAALEAIGFVVGLVGGSITLITALFFFVGGTGMIWWQAILGGLCFLILTAFLYWMAEQALNGKLFEEGSK